MVLSGDTLFVGDVGRPDLVTSKGFTSQDMAGMLYDSLTGKLLGLPDETSIWPAHGAGSACGKNIGKELHSTIGAQKQGNPNLAPMSRADFVTRVTTDLAPAPDYFGHDAETNRSGAAPLGDLPEPVALSPARVAALQKEGAVVLDVREGVHFCGAHIPGARHVGLGGQFAPWAGAVVPMGARLVLVADDLEEVHEARLRLARVGLEDVVGYLDGGLAAWVRDRRPTRTFENVSPAELAERLEGMGAPIVIDVRKPSEYEGGHLPGALSRPLDGRLSARDLPAYAPLVVVCQSGYRSAIAAAILAASHAGPILNLVGGTNAWREAGRTLEKGSAALPG
jgi:rhodanese-related sulfurtransferase